MPYHKNKQQAFQAAQQGIEQVKDIYAVMDENSPEYGHNVKRLQQEINEAEQQIENALEVASETQRYQLNDFKTEIEYIKRKLY